MKLNKSSLDSKWLKAATVAELFILTIEEMNNCNISYDVNSQPKQTELPKPLTAKLVKKAPSSDRGKFPEGFPTFDKLHAKVKEMIEANESRETVEAKFKQPYQYTASCWLCRILPRKTGSHGSAKCPLLKNLFTTYPTLDNL